MVWRLIRKDLYLYRWLIGGALVAGLASLLIADINDMSGNIGFILLMTSIVALGVFIAIYGIMTERQDKDAAVRPEPADLDDAVHRGESRVVVDRVPDAVARSDGDDRRADPCARQRRSTAGSRSSSR